MSSLGFDVDALPADLQAGALSDMGQHAPRGLGPSRHQHPFTGKLSGVSNASLTDDLSAMESAGRRCITAQFRGLEMKLHMKMASSLLRYAVSTLMDLRAGSWERAEDLSWRAGSAIWIRSSAPRTRPHHGYLIYDTLFALDAQQKISSRRWLIATRCPEDGKVHASHCVTA